MLHTSKARNGALSGPPFSPTGEPAGAVNRWCCKSASSPAVSRGMPVKCQAGAEASGGSTVMFLGTVMAQGNKWVLGDFTWSLQHSLSMSG